MGVFSKTDVLRKPSTTLNVKCILINEYTERPKNIDIDFYSINIDHRSIL